MKIKLIKNKEKPSKDAVEISLLENNEIKYVTDKDGVERLFFGLGKKRDEVNLRNFFILCRRLIRTAKNHKIKNLVLDFNEFKFPEIKLDDGQIAKIMAEQFSIADFDFDKYKKEKKEILIEEIILTNAPQNIKVEIEKGLLVGEESNRARELANTPGGEITPIMLAEKAKKACAGTDIKISIFDEKKMAQLKMGAILGVAKGSPEKPRFIVMEYWGESGVNSKKEKAPIVLVGKGITFDSGGLSLKPADSMLGMHLDMSGGAVVIHTLVLAAKLKLKKNIVGLVPTAENMPSGDSYRPGDILTTMSGKTVEVLNTDAEGRLILADALTYAERYKPQLVVDIATLTGASVVALGERASAIFTKDKKIQDLVQEAGEETGEYVWPLPLWEEYEDDIKGNFADLVNSHKSGGRWGGAIQGAVFLYQFAKKYPWVHIDMAPRMISIKSDFMAIGSTGEPIKLLLRLIEKHDK